MELILFENSLFQRCKLHLQNLNKIDLMLTYWSKSVSKRRVDNMICKNVFMKVVQKLVAYLYVISSRENIESSCQSSTIIFN